MLPSVPSCKCSSSLTTKVPRHSSSLLAPTPSRHWPAACSPHTSSRHEQQQQWQQQQKSDLIAAAAGKGFGSPSKPTKGFSPKTSSKGRRKCPCGSGQPYDSCCARYHSGSALAPTPEALLRARFSAYALQEIDYLVRTTHRQNPEYTGDNKSYARSLKKTAAAVEYIQLDVAGPVTQRELSQASAAYMQNINANSSSSSSGGRGDGQAAAGAAGAAAGQDEDAFLRFSVRFRQRDGGPQEVATEVSHFKKVDGTTWLYFNEVEFIRDGAGANSS